MSWSLAREGGVVMLAHANPPRHTLTAAGVRELGEELDRLETDTSLRALVLTGAGEGVFIAHYEVGDLAAAAEASARAPLALAAAKRAIRRGLELPLEAGLAVEQEEFERTMRSTDAATAMRAWLRGERFEWTGE